MHVCRNEPVIRSFDDAFRRQPPELSHRAANRLRDLCQAPVQNPVLIGVVHQAHHIKPYAPLFVCAAAQVGISKPIGWVELKRWPPHTPPLENPFSATASRFSNVRTWLRRRRHSSQ
jgi:hypothetical protein